MCERRDLGNGQFVMVCGGRRRVEFCSCGRVGKFLCDWKVPAKQSGTCDRPICEDHAKEVAPGKHLCQECQKKYESWKARHPDAVPPATQGSLFDGK